MKEYKRLDPNRPYTLSELLQKTKFMKKSQVIKLLEKAIASQPSLKERALYMNKEMDFYSTGIISVLSALSSEFRTKKEAFEEQKLKDSPAHKLFSLLDLS
jgi:hypothetical protein